MIRKRTEKKDPVISPAGDKTSHQVLKPVKLLKPGPGSVKSVMQALQKRMTIREISDRKLSLQTLSDLLWAACGVNRKKGG